MKSTQDNREHWRQQVREFEVSGLSRQSYCDQKQIKIYQLDYWRKKFGKAESVEPISTKSWIPLAVRDDRAAEETSGICLRIGRLAIEVKPGFDRELLAEVLRVVDPTC
jgi:hypothetical protein